MNEPPWERIDELFNRALGIPEVERAAFLRTEAGDEPELVEYVERLLAQDAAAETLLDRGIAHVAADVLDGSVPLLRRVGPYRVIEVLGRGGMGVVYLGEREDLGFRVAIKVLRDATLSPARRDRFEREQQTLAQLDHPGIARLIDAAVLPDGTPYFVMEHVRGEPILAHCAHHACTVTERLRLFRAVCEAVHHAHRRAVIHRDLKSSNILVTQGERGATSTVKLLDFGIARHLDDGGAQTRTGLRLMTPANAAPEQIRGEPAGVYTDVYALGLILYELLAGRPAHDLEGLTAAQIETRIVEGGVRRPSERIGETGASAAPDAAAFGRAAWADLDVLCLTAMHTDPHRRYPSVETLLRDLDHFDAGEPLEAQPDSPRYRAGKFVARNRRSVVAALLLAMAVVGATAFHTSRLRAQRDRAEVAAARAEQIADYLIGLFEAGDPFAVHPDSLDIETLLERGFRQVEQLDGQPLLQAQMLDVLGRVHTRLGDYDRAGDMLHRALELRHESTDPLETAVTLSTLAELHALTGKRDSAEAELREALRIRELHLPPRHPTLASNLNQLGSLLTETGRYDEADVVYNLALQILRQTYTGPHPDIGETLSNIGVNHFNRGDNGAAEPYYRDALAVDRAWFGDDHPSVATRLANLASVIEARGDLLAADTLLSDALRIFRDRLGEDHYLTSYYSTQLGSMLRRSGQLDRAENVLRDVVAAHERTLGGDHPNTTVAVNQLALTLAEGGRFAEAEPLLRRAAENFRRALGDEHYYSGSTLCQLAHAVHMNGRAAEAEPLFRQGLAIIHAVLPPGHASRVITDSRFGALLVTLGRYEEAEPLLLESYDALATGRGPEHEHTRAVADALARLYAALGSPAKAAEWSERSGA